MGKVKKILEEAKRPRPGSVTIRADQELILDELSQIAADQKPKKLSRNRLIVSVLKDFIESYKKTKGVK